MQRLLTVILVLVVTLYGSSPAFSTSPDETPVEAAVSQVSATPHIALILPLESTSFGQAADIVKEGFVAATMREQALPLMIRIYATTDDPLDTFITYRQALDAGAVMVVGPLTRNGVSALASSSEITVPTLALNAADNNQTLPKNLYLFGLQLENEANQLAKLAMSGLKSNAIIIGDDSSLSRRLQTAFAEQWLSRQGNTADSVRYANDPTVLRQFRKLTAGKNNLIFLTLDATKSRVLRSFLDPEVPVYATSQIFVSADDFLFNNDLNDIQFMDMPWLLQPDHPAVMAYRHAEKTRSTDMERLYALGIDAFRIMTYILQTRSAQNIAFDGVTGYIRFVPPNQFVRESIAARIDKGRVQLITTQKDTVIDER
ncbi:MAG: penicillin-binding protein activator [Pseudomonadota bacterium]